MRNIFLLIIVFIGFWILNSCNNPSNKSEFPEKNIPEKTTFKSENKQSENSNSIELSTDKINENILNKYIDGVFEIEKELPSALTYHDNGVISRLDLCTRETNNSRSVFSGNQHEKRVSFYENGQLKHCYENINEKRHGKLIDYYENGEIKYEVLYQFGEKEGEEIYYYENGNIRMKKNLKNGVTDGEIICFYENGKLQIKEKYKNHIQYGKSIRYYEDGKVEYTCDDYEFFRLCKGYYKNEKIEKELKYNLITGKCISSIFYDENGIIKEQHFYNENGDEIKNQQD